MYLLCMPWQIEERRDYSTGRIYSTGRNETGLCKRLRRKRGYKRRRSQRKRSPFRRLRMALIWSITYVQLHSFWVRPRVCIRSQMWHKGKWTPLNFTTCIRIAERRTTNAHLRNEGFLAMIVWNIQNLIYSISILWCNLNTHRDLFCGLLPACDQQHFEGSEWRIGSRNKSAYQEALTRPIAIISAFQEW